MVYRRTINTTSYTFGDLRDLLAKATPPRSGDRLAGVAADSAEQMIAARMALADVPLKQFLNEAVVPYEDDEVTRLIIDSHDAPSFAAVSSLTVGGFRDWLLSDAATGETLASSRAGHHAGNGGRRLQADAQSGPDPGRQQVPRDLALSQHHRPGGPARACGCSPITRPTTSGHHRLDRSTACCYGCGDAVHRHQSGHRQCRAVIGDLLRHARRDHRALRDTHAVLRAHARDHHARSDRAAARRSTWCSSRSRAPRPPTAASASICRCCARRERRRVAAAAARSAKM